MRVLVTRPAAASDRFVLQLQAAGHQAIVSPVIWIERTGAPIPEAGFDGLLATSSHAFANLPAESLAAENLLALPLYLVGERTAAAARARGFGNFAVVSADAAALSEFLRRKARPASRFLYLAGEDRKLQLENNLKADGHCVEVVVAYRAAAAGELAPDVAAALRAGSIDAVAHFSRRSAELFVRLAQATALAELSRKILHLCLSADVAAGLEALAPVSVRTASTPDLASLIALLGSSAD